ncbi:MAG: apolipoprotein N-acyltransferase [Terriglobales bacterium]
MPKALASGSRRISTAGAVPVTATLTWTRALLLAGFGAAFLALAFPPLSLSVLAWVALAPIFLLCLRAAGAHQAFWCGYVAGAIFFAADCPWVAYTVRRYGGLSRPEAGLVFALFLAVVGLFFALFAWLGYWLCHWAPWPWLTLPALWTAIEFLRTYVPMGGFPWDLVGYSQANHAGFMLSVTVAGVYGAGFLIALENGVLAAAASHFSGWFAQPPQRGARTAWGWPITPAIVWFAVVGFASFPFDPPQLQAATLRAVLVQPNANPARTWSDPAFVAYLRRLTRLSRPGTAMDPGAPALVLWPESPAPLEYAAEPQLQSTVTALTRADRAALLFGETALLHPSAPTRGQDPINAARMIHPDGLAGARYAKRHLVPFGEYVPLPGWLRRWVGIRAMVSQVGDFVPGQRLTLFHLPAGHAEGNDAAGAYPFGALICYESIFPALARQEVRGGAQWLVNLSDDGWYGHSAARPQGLLMARVRAMENRRWLLRDTNDGITAIVDPYGRVTARLALSVPAALRGHFAARTDRTFYTEHGDWLPWLCTILVGLMFLAGGVRRWRRTG